MIVYDPKKLLQKISPEKKIKRLVRRGNVSLNRSALSFVDDIDFIDKKQVSRVALETIKNYKRRINVEDEAKKILKDPKQLIQRVQNEVVTQIAKEIRNTYEGEKYEWLPSDAAEPDPEHQLKYGKIFTVGDGEMPGDRYGCKCGMRILVKESELKLG